MRRVLGVVGASGPRHAAKFRALCCQRIKLAGVQKTSIFGFPLADLGLKRRWLQHFWRRTAWASVGVSAGFR